MKNDQKNILLVGGGLGIAYLAYKTVEPAIEGAGKTIDLIGDLFAIPGAIFDAIGNIVAVPVAMVESIGRFMETGFWPVNHEAISQTDPELVPGIIRKEIGPGGAPPAVEDDYYRLGVILVPGTGDVGVVKANILVPTWINWSVTETHAIVQDFPQDSYIYLWAIPAEGWRFNYWERKDKAGEPLHGMNPYTVKLSESKTYGAYFVRV